MLRSLLLAFLCLDLVSCHCSTCGSSGRSSGQPAPADLHLVHDPAIRDEAGHLQMVVEIPAGTCAKWEVDKASGRLEWERRDGVPRVVDYLGYPGNYGMIPRTLLPESEGGDGDPLDVLLLGPAVERGGVVPCRLIGVLVLRDGGEQDDKLIAVPLEGPFARIEDVAELEGVYPGVREIVERWFRNYKGPGRMESEGFRGPEEARALLEQAAAAHLRRS